MYERFYQRINVHLRLSVVKKVFKQSLFGQQEKQEGVGNSGQTRSFQV
jgi:hypothetical protein